MKMRYLLAAALVVGVVVGAVVFGADSAADMKRYVRMRRM
jgi:hypothetical protein